MRNIREKDPKYIKQIINIVINCIPIDLTVKNAA